MEKMPPPSPHTTDLKGAVTERPKGETGSTSLEHVVNSDQEDSKADEAASNQDEYDWNTDPHNPYNWSAGRKAVQVAAISSIAFLT